MRVSWRQLDWISERDRSEIERRMHALGGGSGLLDRVDFAGVSSASGAFEIRITANAAKRQIIAVRRDAQRVKAFNSAFEALERGVASVQKTSPAPPQPEGAAAQRTPRPALTPPVGPSRLRSAARAAFVLAAALTAAVGVAFGWQHGAREVKVGTRALVARLSALATLPAHLRDDESAYSAIADVGTARR